MSEVSGENLTFSWTWVPPRSWLPLLQAALLLCVSCEAPNRPCHRGPIGMGVHARLDLLQRVRNPGERQRPALPTRQVRFLFFATRPEVSSISSISRYAGGAAVPSARIAESVIRVHSATENVSCARLGTETLPVRSLIALGFFSFLNVF